MTDAKKYKEVWATLRKRLPLEILSVLVLSGIVYYVIENFDLNLVWVHLSSRLDWRLGTGLFFCFLVFAAYSLRLKVLIETDFYPAFQIVNIGSLLNVLLPFRIGDILRIYVARQYYTISGKTMLMAVLVEKFFDLLCVTLLASAAIAFSTENLIPASSVFFLAAVVIAAFITYIVLRFPRLIEWGLAHLPSVLAGQIRSLISIMALKEPLRVSVLTVCIWVANVACTYAVFTSLLPNFLITGTDAIALTAIAALSVAIPGAPAGIGLFEAGVVAYLIQVHGVDGELALGCALIFHGVLVVPPVVGLFMGLTKRLPRAVRSR